MKLSLPIFLMLIIIWLPGCSPSNDCLISDTVEEILSVKTSNGEHFIYIRITGFSEKESFYEIYESVPKFNDCGIANISPISQIHVDSTSGKPVKLELHSGILKLHYSEGVVDMEGLREIEVKVNNF